jgi:hypothetical protein
MFKLDLLSRGTESGCIRNNCSMRDPRDGAQAREKLIVEALASIGILVTLIGQLEARGCQLGGGNKRIDGKAVHQAADKDAGPAK